MVCRSLTIAVIGAACIASGAANATVYDFTLTGSRAATFSIDTKTAPSNATALQVQYNAVAGTFKGAAGTASTISFGLSQVVSDFEIDGTSLGFTQFSGPIVFTGTAASPMFTVGTANLTSIVSGASTLTITAEPASVPEPASLAILGVGAVSLVALRRRRLQRAA